MATATRQEVVGVYRRRAARYDLTSHLYWLIGYPVDHYFGTTYVAAGESGSGATRRQP